MAALPTDFLTTVIAEVATIKGIMDAHKQVKEKDPTVTTCAKIAYIQICKYCRRPFHYGTRTEYFDTYVGPTLLRTMPLDRTKPVSAIVNGTDVPADQVKVVRNRFVLFDDTVDDSSRPRYPDIEFTSTAGIKLLEDNTTLYTAVQMQTIANYHRRDSYGLSEAAGEKGTSRVPIDSGEIIDSVKLLLDELIYNGSGYTLDGE